MKKYYKMNQYITATEVRVIGPDEKQIGVMTRDEAIFKARQMGMDLVLMAEKAKPPVVKIIDFSKFKYQEAQKIKASKKQGKTAGQKEIRFTPFIGQKDFETRIERIKGFLQSGHTVKLTVKFTGRQITRKEFGETLLKRAINDLVEFATQQTSPKWQGKLLWAIVAPKKEMLKEKMKMNENEKK